MVRYFYVWTPLLIIGTAVLLPRVWLDVIALMLVALVLLVVFAALTYAIAWTWRVLRGLTSHCSRRRTGANATLSPASSGD